MNFITCLWVYAAVPEANLVLLCEAASFPDGESFCLCESSDKVENHSLLLSPVLSVLSLCASSHSKFVL